MEAVCCFCNSTLARGAEGKVNGPDLKSHMLQHNFRACGQKLYYSSHRFRQHLLDSHNISHDGTLFAGWTLLLKSCRRERPSIFNQPSPDKTPHGRPSVDTELVDKKPATTASDETPPTLPSSFMDFSDFPQRTEPNKLRRKASANPMADSAGQEPRISTQSYARPVIAVTDGSPPHRRRFPFSPLSKEKSKEKTDASTFPDVRGESTCPTFYRKRLDASMRNRLYIAEGEQPLSSASQQLYMKMPGSTFGNLILHSSRTAALPVRMTTSVDIYTLP